MPDTRISALAELLSPGANDELVIVDKADLTMAASGTDKRIKASNFVPGALGYTPINKGGDTGIGLLKFGTGDLIDYLATPMDGKQIRVAQGTAAAPITSGDGPTVKIVRIEQITESTMPSGVGANNQGNAALYVHSRGTASSEAQTTALWASAESQSTQTTHNDDASALNVQARIYGSGTGIAMSYFEGRRDTATGRVSTLQLGVRNFTAVDGTYNPGGVSDTGAIWIFGNQTLGATKNGCAIQLANPFNVPFEVGIANLSQNGGGCLNAFIRDDGSNTTSIDIRGTHTTAISTTTGAGDIQFGAVPPSGFPRLFARKDYTATQASGNQHTAYVYAQAKGAWDTGHMLYNFLSQVQEPGVTANKPVSGAVNNGSGLIRLTVTGHGYATGDRIIVDSVGGVTAANGSWIVTVINTNTLDLQGSTFSGTYTSGGITTNRPGYSAYLALVAPIVARGGLTGANLHADDVNGFFASNNGTAIASDAFYVANSPTVSGSAWATCFTADANALYGIRLNGTYVNAGIDLSLSTQTGPAIKLGNGHNIQLGTGAGTKMGTASNEKWALWGKTPVVQPPAYTVTNLTADRTLDANFTTIDELADILGTLIQDIQSWGGVG